MRPSRKEGLPSQSHFLDRSQHTATPPDSDGITQTRTLLFNETVAVEYLDGQTKSLHSGTLVKEDAFCVQMLRRAFEPACWKALD